MPPSVAITGSGSFLPGNAVGNDRLKALMPDLPIEVLSSYFGIDQRYMVLDPETCERIDAQDSLSMAVEASRRAIEAACIDLQDVDLIVTNTTTPSAPLPPISFELQRALGIQNAQIFDIRGGCAASVQAMILAKTWIETGLARTALVCGVECTTPAYFKYLRQTPEPDMDIVLNGFIFGDGAGALIIQAASEARSPREQRRVIRTATTRSQFPQAPVGFEILNEVGENPMVVTTSTRHSNKAIAKILPEVMKAAFGTLTSESGRPFDAFDRVIVPQVNESLLRTAYPEAVESFVHNFRRMGNIPGAAISIAYDQTMKGPDAAQAANLGIVAIETVSWTYAVAELIRE